MSLFTRKSVKEMRDFVSNRTKVEAYEELKKAAEQMVKECRYYPYRSKIDILRVPLARLKHAK